MGQGVFLISGRGPDIQCIAGITTRLRAYHAATHQNTSFMPGVAGGLTICADIVSGLHYLHYLARLRVGLFSS